MIDNNNTGDEITMKTTMPTARRGIVLVVLPCLLSSSSSTTNAFRGHNGGMPQPPRHHRRRHRQNGMLKTYSPSYASYLSYPSSTTREYKFSSSLEEGERRRISRQIDEMSTMTSSSTTTTIEVAPPSSGSTSSRGGVVVSTSKFDDTDNNNMEDVVRVLSASLLVTGNAVGSSMFVLPEAVRGVGLASGTAIFIGERGPSSLDPYDPYNRRCRDFNWSFSSLDHSLLKRLLPSSRDLSSFPLANARHLRPILFFFAFPGLYLYNLISGLLLADVAITLHESSECDVPSSFKDFVDAALSSEIAGTFTSVLSLVSNGCFLAYGTIAAGPMMIDILRSHNIMGMGGSVDPIIGTCAFAFVISLFAITQTNAGLERLANYVVFVVFSSFAFLLLPSLASVSDPLGTFLTPGTNIEEGYGNAMASAVPLLLSSLMYQNIVPSVTKLLDFDRAKSTIAISIGSFIPMLMYVAWCYASLGGGLDASTSSSAGSAALASFSMSALFVSSLTAVMSLAEEYEAIFSRRTTAAAKYDDDGDCIAPSSRFSIPAVAASVIPPVAMALAFVGGGDLTAALHFNGAFIVPILYGILPTILYGGVRQLRVRDTALHWMDGLPQLMLGAGTICAIGQEIVQEVSCLPN